MREVTSLDRGSHFFGMEKHLYRKKRKETRSHSGVKRGQDLPLGGCQEVGDNATSASGLYYTRPLTL